MSNSKNGWQSFDRNIGKRHYVDGVLHCEDGPAEIRPNGTEVYYQNGLLHRDGDEPAMTTPGKTKKYAKDGVYHRGGGLPAIIWGKAGNRGVREEYWIFGELQKMITVKGDVLEFDQGITRHDLSGISSFKKFTGK